MLKTVKKHRAAVGGKVWLSDGKKGKIAAYCAWAAVCFSGERLIWQYASVRTMPPMLLPDTFVAAAIVFAFMYGWRGRAFRLQEWLDLSVVD